MVRRYAANTQLNRRKPPRSPMIVGIAVATIMLSTAAMKVAISEAASTSRRHDRRRDLLDGLIHDLGSDSCNSGTRGGASHREEP
jgi:hypothetical protein